MKFATCNDGNDYLEYDGVVVRPARDTDQTPIPPSAELMNFLNENHAHATGWTSQAIAAALVDNHFSSMEAVASSGHASGNGAVLVADLWQWMDP